MTPTDVPPPSPAVQRGQPYHDTPPFIQSTLVADVAENVWPAMGGTLPPPPVSAVFPLAEAEAAHALLQEGKVLGKVVLDVASGVECPAQE